MIHGEENSRVDAAVLAIGSLPPQPLGGVSDAALESGLYVTEPWGFLASATPDTRARKVVLVGPGLTAVDVLLELSALWPNATFEAISRHGLLPEPHLEAASAPSMTGETPESMLAAVNYMRHSLEGLEVEDVSGFGRKVDGFMYGNAAAKSALDMAVYDLVGKREKKTVAELLGGIVRREIPVLWMLAAADRTDSK